jgi:hypothetical protein
MFQNALFNAHHLRELKALIDIQREPWASSIARWLRWMAKFSRGFKLCDHKIPEFF